MENFNKTIRIGKDADSHNIFCKIEYKDHVLSISGVIGPKKNGNAAGSCGQIVMGFLGHEETITPAPGWDMGTIVKFFKIWDKWHLNDMQAGSPRQTAWLDAHKADWEKARTE